MIPTNDPQSRLRPVGQLILEADNRRLFDARGKIGITRAPDDFAERVSA
jgi:hypothetical protein